MFWLTCTWRTPPPPPSSPFSVLKEQKVWCFYRLSFGWHPAGERAGSPGRVHPGGRSTHPYFSPQVIYKLWLLLDLAFLPKREYRLFYFRGLFIFLTTLFLKFRFLYNTLRQKACSYQAGKIPNPQFLAAYFRSDRLNFYRAHALIPRNRFRYSLLYVAWARIIKYFFKEPRNRFPAWRAGTTTLFDVPTCQPDYIGRRNRLWDH